MIANDQNWEAPRMWPCLQSGIYRQSRVCKRISKDKVTPRTACKRAFAAMNQNLSKGFK